MMEPNWVGDSLRCRAPRRKNRSHCAKGPHRDNRRATKGADMEPIVERLKKAHAENGEAIFTLFTLSGHALSGRIAAIAETIVLEAGSEKAEVSADRIEAFSLRKG
jgi:hypothetical protein